MRDTAPPQTPDYIARPSVQFDWIDWLPYIEDSDIPEAQRQEWIETLWVIVLGFVDLGFDVKPTSENCGEAIDLKAALQSAVVDSGEQEDAHDIRD